MESLDSNSGGKNESRDHQQTGEEGGRLQQTVVATPDVPQVSFIAPAPPAVPIASVIPTPHNAVAFSVPPIGLVTPYAPAPTTQPFSSAPATAPFLPIASAVHASPTLSAIPVTPSAAQQLNAPVSAVAPTTPQQGFSDWLKANGITLLSTGILGSVFSTASAIDRIWKTFGNIRIFSQPLIWIYGAQVMTVFIGFLLGGAWAVAQGRAELRVRKHLERVNRRWVMLLAIWALTYILYFFQQIGVVYNIQLAWSGAVFAMLQKFEIGAYFILYIALTKSPRGGKDTYEFTVGVFTGIILFMLLCVELTLQTIAARGAYPGVAANAISACVLAVSIAMFVGRIDSQTIGLHPLILVSCYGLSAIQPLFITVRPEFLWFLYILNLALKTVFLLAVIYIVDQDRLSKYIELHIA